MSPGWYPDPDGRPHQRWFDGHDWTSELAPSGSNPPRLSIVGDSGFAPTPAPASAYSASPAPLPTMLATAPAPTPAQYGINSLPAYAPDAPAEAPAYGVQTSSAFQTASMAPPSTPAFPSLANLPGPNLAGALPAADPRLALAYNPSPEINTTPSAAPEAPVATPAPQAHRPVVQGHSGIATPPSGTTMPATNRPRAQRALDIATQTSALGIAYDRADYGAAAPGLSTEDEISEAASRAATLAAFANGGLFADPATPTLLAPSSAPAPAPTATPAAPSTTTAATMTPAMAPAMAPTNALAISAPAVPAYRVPETAAFVPPVATTPVSSSYQPFSMIPEVRKGTDLAPSRTYTGAAWTVALLPLVLVGAAVALVLFAPEFYSRFAQVGILAVATLVSFALAARDRAELLRAGHARAASPAWMILSPIGYFIARLARTSRESRGGGWPLVVFVAIVAACTAGVTLLPEWALSLLLLPGN